jgi:hypothetical protein
LIRDKKAVAGGEESRNRAARRLMCDACLLVHTTTSVKSGDLRSRELYLSGRLPKRRSTRGDLHEVDYHAGIGED